jgi:hypothetical protein
MQNPEKKQLKDGGSRPGLRIIMMGLIMVALSVFNVIVASSPENFQVEQNLALQINTTTLLHSISILILAAFVAYRSKLLYNRKWKHRL